MARPGSGPSGQHRLCHCGITQTHTSLSRQQKLAAENSSFSGESSAGKTHAGRLLANGPPCMRVVPPKVVLSNHPVEGAVRSKQSPRTAPRLAPDNDQADGTVLYLQPVLCIPISIYTRYRSDPRGKPSTFPSLQKPIPSRPTVPPARLKIHPRALGRSLVEPRCVFFLPPASLLLFLGPPFAVSHSAPCDADPADRVSPTGCRKYHPPSRLGISRPLVGRGLAGSCYVLWRGPAEGDRRCAIPYSYSVAPQPQQPQQPCSPGPFVPRRVTRSRSSRVLRAQRCRSCVCSPAEVCTESGS
jgi:hypothetical protein